MIPIVYRSADQRKDVNFAILPTILPRPVPSAVFSSHRAQHRTQAGSTWCSSGQWLGTFWAVLHQLVPSITTAY